MDKRSNLGKATAHCRVVCVQGSDPELLRHLHARPTPGPVALSYADLSVRTLDWSLAFRGSEKAMPAPALCAPDISARGAACACVQSVLADCRRLSPQSRARAGPRRPELRGGAGRRQKLACAGRLQSRESSRRRPRSVTPVVWAR
ncbi:hypothetical protein U9M48_015744 [Paspalum notatum var. saurae]|uniref:Uncharacterized protein n=1 Tax=Paspalum notatum var. saurae TaxID=547442 RepID=A0AAQ3T4T5_PASNO